MVNLTKIYTRTGDGGQTRLGDGTQVPKTDARVEAYGAVDETNAVLGTVLAAGPGVSTRRLLQPVLNDLFDLGADLCVPEDPAEGTALRVTAAHVRRLEEGIDEVNDGLSDLRSFVLPGGTACAAALHLARTVCRRAERRVWQLVDIEGAARVNGQVPLYLNRLSDLLFVLARAENAAAGGDVLWQPGGPAEGEAG